MYYGAVSVETVFCCLFQFSLVLFFLLNFNCIYFESFFLCQDSNVLMLVKLTFFFSPTLGLTSSQRDYYKHTFVYRSRVVSIRTRCDRYGCPLINRGCKCLFALPMLLSFWPRKLSQDPFTFGTSTSLRLYSPKSQYACSLPALVLGEMYGMDISHSIMVVIRTVKQSVLSTFYLLLQRKLL